MNYKQFNDPKAGPDAFIPSSILDLNDDDSEDEILRKFRTKKKSSQKSSLFIPS
jgi:hypothetical protein